MGINDPAYIEIVQEYR